jgi:hypothetical protein
VQILSICSGFRVAPPLLKPLTFTVLKITANTSPDGTTLTLEGRVVGAWVDELSRAVSTAGAPATPVALDLSGVTFVDAIGAVYLRAAAASGVGLHNSSEFVSGLIRGGQA